MNKSRSLQRLIDEHLHRRTALKDQQEHLQVAGKPVQQQIIAARLAEVNRSIMLISEVKKRR